MKPTASDQLSLPEQLASSTSSCRLWTFETITVRTFIDIYLSGDRPLLVIDGAADPETMEDAWLSIYSAYCSAIATTDLAGMLRRFRQEKALRSRIVRASLAIEISRKVAADEMIAVFREFGFEFDPTLPSEEYHLQLDNITGRLLPDITRLQSLEVQPGTDAKAPSEQGFRDTLFEIGKFQGFEARDTMRLIDYCTALRKLHEHIQYQNNPKRNGRRALR